MKNNDQPTPPSATVAPWSKTGGKGLKNRRAPLIIAALLALVTVLGLLIYGTRRKPDALALAAAVQSTASNRALGPVVSEVHAAVPATAVVAEPAPTASSAAPSMLASAKPVERVAPRAIEQVPNGPRYTYFGGRR